MKKTYTCIVCPQSCTVTLSEDGGNISVEGNQCKRGAEYATNEYQAPVRMITTTVAVKTGPLRRLPVISTGGVPKHMLKQCLGLLYGHCQEEPVKMGDIIIKDILGSGVDIIAARNLSYSMKGMDEHE